MHLRQGYDRLGASSCKFGIVQAYDMAMRVKDY